MTELQKNSGYFVFLVLVSLCFLVCTGVAAAPSDPAHEEPDAMSGATSADDDDDDDDDDDASDDDCECSHVGAAKTTNLGGRALFLLLLK